MVIEELVEVMWIPYWTCHNEDHRHRSIVAAENCVKRSKTGSGRKPYSKESLLKFAKLKRECSNASAMARRLGMSPSNFSRLAKKGELIEGKRSKN